MSRDIRRAMRWIGAILSTGLGLLSAQPILAQGVPPNPFASNYPSAPPQAAARGGREMAPRAVRPRSPRRAEPALLPPADVPGR